MTAYAGTTQTDAYDGDGLRVWKQPGTSSSTRTYFLYDGDTPVVEESNTGAFLAANTYGADGLVSRRSGSTTVCYLFDERGNVAQRTSSTGAVTGSEVYDSYGARTGTAAQPDPFGFGGQAGYYTDLETGLILCTHRFYDPQNGRWLTRDPMGYDGGVNLYGYVGNNPVNRVDPSGYFSFQQLIACLKSGLPDALKDTLTDCLEDPATYLEMSVCLVASEAPPLVALCVARVLAKSCGEAAVKPVLARLIICVQMQLHPVPIFCPPGGSNPPGLPKRRNDPYKPPRYGPVIRPGGGTGTKPRGF